MSVSLLEQFQKLDLPKVEPLLIPPPVKLVTERLGLTLTLTCRLAPEQYGVTRNGKAAGYIRVRWGGLSVAYPDAGDEELYEGAVDGFGSFTDHERESRLLFCLGLIAARIVRE